MAYEGLRAGEQMNKHFEELEQAIYQEKTIPELLPYREDLMDKIDKLVVEQVSALLQAGELNTLFAFFCCCFFGLQEEVLEG